MVHVSYMNDDYYYYNEDTYSLYWRADRKGVPDRGPGEGRVTGVNIDEHKVDFELVSEEETAEEPAKKGRRGSKGRRRKRTRTSGAAGNGQARKDKGKR